MKGNNADWISVKDRLPEEGCEVLTCNHDNKMLVDYLVYKWDEKNENVSQLNYIWARELYDEWDKVVYWMSLPEPPKTGSDLKRDPKRFFEGIPNDCNFEGNSMVWIDIKEKQPKYGDTILTFSLSLFKSGDFPLNIKSVFLLDGKFHNEEFVTHWIPIPDFPKT